MRIARSNRTVRCTVLGATVFHDLIERKIMEIAEFDSYDGEIMRIPYVGR